PAADRRFFVKADGIPAVEEQVASVDDVLVGDADNEVGAGVSGIGFDDDIKAAKADGPWELRGIERMIRQAEDAGVGDAENPRNCRQITLSVLLFNIGFGVGNLLLEGGEDGIAIGTLQWDIAVDDAACGCGVSVEGDAVCAVE